jgi:hypothetical protein
MATEDQLRRMRELIAIHLDMCDRESWPYVCHMASTPEGKKSIEEMIISQASQSGCTISHALDRIERAYNPNRMED